MNGGKKALKNIGPFYFITTSRGQLLTLPLHNFFYRFQYIRSVEAIFCEELGCRAAFAECVFRSNVLDRYREFFYCSLCDCIAQFTNNIMFFNSNSAFSFSE